MKKKLLIFSSAFLLAVVGIGFALSGCSQANNLLLANGVYRFSGADSVSNNTRIKTSAVNVNSQREQDRLTPHFEHESLKNVDFQLNGKPVSLRDYLEKALEKQSQDTLISRLSDTYNSSTTIVL